VKNVIKYIADDGSEWTDKAKAAKRDALHAEVVAIERTIPEPPNSSDKRIAVDPTVMAKAKSVVIELCRREFPNEPVFKHPADKIHPMSFAGRFLDDTGAPLYRIWHRFMCYADGWMYEQPYFALHPEQWRRKQSASA